MNQVENVLDALVVTIRVVILPLQIVDNALINFMKFKIPQD